LILDRARPIPVHKTRSIMNPDTCWRSDTADRWFHGHDRLHARGRLREL